VERGISLDALLQSEGSGLKVGRVNQEFIEKQVDDLKELTESYGERAASKMREDIKQWREKGPMGNKIFDFEIGDLVLVAATKGQVEANKLRPRWQGPYKVVKILSKYKYVVRNVVDGKEMERHAAFIRHYIDQQLNIDANVKAVIAEHQGLLKISSIVGFGEDDDGNYLVKVQ
jgi:hypothetical protein